jgi:pentatricopeptide repeat protein
LTLLPPDTENSNSNAAVNALLFPSVRDCNAALSAFGDQGDLLRALRLFGKMRKAALLQERLRRQTGGLRWPVPAPTLVTYSTLMSRAVRAHKPRVALRLWKMMPAVIEPDVKAMNILLNAYAKLANVKKAQEVLRDMTTTGQGSHKTPRLVPNLVTFNTVLHACQKAHDLDAALQVKADMEAVGLLPDARTYTTLLTTVARAKSAASGLQDPTVALSLLQEMQRRQVSPNGMTYSAFIDACGRCGRIDLALQGLRLMQRQKEQEGAKRGGNQEGTANTYMLDNEVGAWTSAINVCGKTGRWETAIRLFGSMKKLGCQPNKVTCGCLTDSLLRAGRTAETLQVLRYMKNEGIVPSEVMYTSLMTRAGRLVELEKHRPHHHSHHNIPATTTAAEDPLCAAEASEAKAIEVYTELMKSLMDAGGGSKQRPSGKSNNRDSNTLLVKVFLVFQQMKAAGAEPDLACFNALLRACGRAGDVNRGLDVLRQIQASPHLEPNDRSWRELLRAAATARQADTAQAIWHRGLAYRRHQRLVDEPETLWTPSVTSLQCLWTAHLRQATVVDPVRQVALLEGVVQAYDDLLLGDRRLGMHRMDPMDVLDDRRTMLLVVHALATLRPLLLSDDARAEELRTMGRAILQLECFQERTASLGWAAQKAVAELRSWD